MNWLDALEDMRKTDSVYMNENNWMQQYRIKNDKLEWKLFEDKEWRRMSLSVLDMDSNWFKVKYEEGK